MVKCKNCGHEMYVSNLDSSCNGHVVGKLKGERGCIEGCDCVNPEKQV